MAMRPFRKPTSDTFEEDLARARSHEWTPPANELGTAVPMRLVLSDAGNCAITVHSVIAFSCGFEFVLSAECQSGKRKPLPSLAAAKGENRFTLALHLADGRVVGERVWQTGAGESRPVMVGQGGVYTKHGFDLPKWLWPLPPPGPLTLVFAWPGIVADARGTTDVAPILAAAAECRALWPDSDHLPGCDL